jgi:hypothetical protein
LACSRELYPKFFLGCINISQEERRPQENAAKSRIRTQIVWDPCRLDRGDVPSGIYSLDKKTPQVTNLALLEGTVREGGEGE